MSCIYQRVQIFFLFFIVISGNSQADDVKNIDEKLLSICSPYQISITDADIDYSNISKEFVGTEYLQFQKKLIKQIQVSSINPVFPNAYFFARSFETYRIGYLYERIIFQGDMQALSLLIRIASNNQDQVSNDAKSALAFIHFQMNSDVDNQRGIELIKIAIKGLNSYPATLFWGRSHVWGEYYSKKDIKIAMNYLAAAGRIPGERREQKNPIDILNFQDVHTSTLKYLIENVSDMPYKEIYEPLYKQSMEIFNSQQNYKKKYAKSSEFNKIEFSLLDINQFISSAESSKLFQIDKSLITTTDWDLLNSTLSKLEEIAKHINSSDSLNSQQKDFVLKIEKLNQKLQNLLVQSEKLLINQMKASGDKFPSNVEPLIALRDMQHGLSRSCSLSVTLAVK